MSTPPQDPNQPPPYPGSSPYPGPSPYPGQPQQYPGQPNQFGGPVPQQAPTQPGYNPYAVGGGGGNFGYAPPGELAGWGSRVAASILDSLLAVVAIAVGAVLAVVLNGSLEALNTPGTVALSIGYVAAFAIQLWNRVYRQGRTGQSVGKQLVGLKVVSADTGELIGMGRNFGREVCALVFNNVCFLNLLWPLWDDKNQTWHDKVVTDLVIKI